MNTWRVMTYLLSVAFIATHVVFTVWVFIGGWFDLMHMFRDLSMERVDLDDNGRVISDNMSDHSG